MQCISILLVAVQCLITVVHGGLGRRLLLTPHTDLLLLPTYICFSRLSFLEQFWGRKPLKQISLLHKNSFGNWSFAAEPEPEQRLTYYQLLFMFLNKYTKEQLKIHWHFHWVTDFLDKYQKDITLCVKWSGNKDNSSSSEKYLDSHRHGNNCWQSANICPNSPSRL